MTDEDALKVWQEAYIASWKVGGTDTATARVIQTAFAEREAAMVAEIAKLRKALKPFAGIVAGDGDDFSTWRSEVVIRCEVTVGEIHEARAALKGSDQ